MSDVSPTDDLKNATMSSDAVAEWVVQQTNKIAELNDRSVVTKHLMSVFAVHMTEDGTSHIPSEVYVREALGAFLSLEARIVAIETALIKSGIALPDPEIV